MISANGWYPGVKLLLDTGMKSNLVDYTGRSALHLAARFGNFLLLILHAFSIHPLTYTGPILT